MTDFTIIRPVSLSSPAFPSMWLPRLGFGQVLAQTLEDFGHALDLSYGQTYRIRRSQSPIVLEGSEKGRDPSW